MRYKLLYLKILPGADPSLPLLISHALPHSKYKHYSWSFKLNAVKKATGGESVHDIAKELDITNAATIYCWIRNWRLKGIEGLMSKSDTPREKGSIQAISEKSHQQ